ncbi:MAG: squalene/phytoene synthase family protein, partial [Pirellulales bacterium]|nr:squalene/phytoene synthase family protein [Pirellulales bacterium]
FRFRVSEGGDHPWQHVVARPLTAHRSPRTVGDYPLSDTLRPTSLDASYRHCAAMSRRSASNFWFAFYLLPREKRLAMCALYAFLRKTDDLGDSDEPVDVRRAAIDAWREQLAAAECGNARDAVFPALMDTIKRYEIPVDLLTEAIDGVESDLNRDTFETYLELEHYCYQVASTVGLACVRIWGYTTDAAFAPARACGLAFQLTNILRDLGEDHRRGRCYLPAEDLRRFDLTPESFFTSARDARMAHVLDLEIARVEAKYREAAALTDFLTRDGRRVFAAMFATYRGLLARLREQGTGIIDARVRLSRPRKLMIVGQSIVAPRRLIAGSARSAERLEHGLVEARS